MLSDAKITEEETAPVIVALDGMEEQRALELARSLRGEVWGFKINDLLLRSGAEVIPRLKSYGNVFCDAKLHDIPNTVANQVAVLEGAGADLITIHCAGGERMLEAARAARQGGARLLGVTVLTSFSDQMSLKVYGRAASPQAELFSEAALRAGLDGIVCSPRELEVAARVDPARKLLRVTPGVRPGWHDSPDDQQRVLAPAEAVRAGADLLVIGRPITSAEDPEKACARIAEELRSARP